ncbi:hypothetical protein WDU94_012536, partial [Cyamophila willieti]
GDHKPEAARNGSYPTHHHGNQNPQDQQSNANQTESNQTLSNAMGNYGDALMMGATLTNWGNGYGWGVGWGWNQYYSNCHDMSYETCAGADLSCDDADYGMDWGGDICF